MVQGRLLSWGLIFDYLIERECDMIKTITFQELMDLDLAEVNYINWRHGSRIQYHINIDEQDYLSEYMDCVPDDGIQDYGNPIKLFPAHQVMKPVWEIVK